MNALQLPLQEVTESHHKLLDVLLILSRIALPINKTLLDSVKLIWQTLASVPPTCQRANKKCYLPAKEMEFLFTHPPPNSVVDMLSSRGHQHHLKSSPTFHNIFIPMLVCLYEPPKKVQILQREIFGPSTYFFAAIHLKTTVLMGWLRCHQTNLFNIIQHWKPLSSLWMPAS